VGLRFRADLLTQGQTRWSILLSTFGPKSLFISVMARVFIVAEPDAEHIVALASRTLGRPCRWLRPVARRYIKTFGTGGRPRLREVERFLRGDGNFRRAIEKQRNSPAIVHWDSIEPRMHPVATAADWEIPAIPTANDLAVWLRVPVRELEWFADLRNLGAKQSSIPLQHYRYRVLSKPDGNVRLIEAPKDRLKSMQRKILTGILAHIPVHSAVHGFVKGRSIKTFAAPHAGKRVILRMDLADFFPRLGRLQIQAFFRTAGYPERVADLLGALCTNAAPRTIWRGIASGAAPFTAFQATQLYGRPHLPQGAPASPALANHCMYRADCRLSGLAQAAEATYTRYADDLAFSGDDKFERSVNRFAAHVAAILSEEGFAVNHRKTRVMRRSVRQHLAGVVVNRHANVDRQDFDRLKAILTNCVRHGPDSQNRDGHPSFRAHLEGRISFVEMINAQKGARLREIFEKIQWQ
jgi:RNA-directed DNA polymerase